MSHDLGYKFISADHLEKRLLEKEGPGMVVIDVRDPKSYREGHIPGAALLPQKIVGKNIKKIDILKETVLVGADEPSAEDAARTLVSNAFPHVYVLEGGLGAWKGELESGLENRWSGLRHEATGKVLTETIRKARPGKAKELEAALALYADQARRWKGFITSNLLLDGENPNRYLFIEKWDDGSLRASFLKADDPDRRELKNKLEESAELESEKIWKLIG